MKTIKITNIEQLQSDSVVVDNVNVDLISRLYDTSDEGIPLDEFYFEGVPQANQYFILKNGSQSALAHFNAETRMINRVEKLSAYGIEPRNAEQAFAMDALMRQDIQLIALTGESRNREKPCLLWLLHCTKGGITTRSTSHARLYRSQTGIWVTSPVMPKRK